jgi:hypothetical protein
LALITLDSISAADLDTLPVSRPYNGENVQEQPIFFELRVNPEPRVAEVRRDPLMTQLLVGHHQRDLFHLAAAIAVNVKDRFKSTFKFGRSDHEILRPAENQATGDIPGSDLETRSRFGL